MPEPLSSAQATRHVTAVLQRFRRQKPLRAGSLLVTIFGDAVAPRGGAVSLAGLIALASPFGISERHVRTAAGRLAREGWFSAHRAGRRAQYQLTDTGAERFRRATQRIYGRNPVTWDRHWTLLTASGRRAFSADTRAQLRWLGFGQIGPGLHLHPDSALARERGWLRELQLDGIVLLRSSSEDFALDRQLVASGWNLGHLARGYRRFVKAFQPLHAAGAAALGERECFVVRTLLIHEYRRIHLQDPLLPPGLVPPGWIGHSAYELCAQLYAAVFTGAEQFLSRSAGTLSATLPPPASETYARFGGLALRGTDSAAAAPAPAEKHSHDDHP